jgi:queuine tRNA-ribosyltransferase
LFDVGLGAGSNAAAAWTVSEHGPATAPAGDRQLRADLGALELALTAPEAFGLQGDVGQAAQALLRQGRHQTRSHGLAAGGGRSAPAPVPSAAPGGRRVLGPVFTAGQPELWTVAVFRLLREVAGEHCTLFTYSASTAVRVALLLAGWAVGTGAAIGDKRQTTAAAIHAGDLARPLDRAWLGRLQRPDAPCRPTRPPMPRPRSPGRPSSPPDPGSVVRTGVRRRADLRRLGIRRLGEVARRDSFGANDRLRVDCSRGSSRVSVVDSGSEGASGADG